MLTNYQRGSNFERQIKDKLTKKGFYCMRSAGSHSVVDVCAISENQVYLIQCKTSNTEKLPDVKQLLKSEVLERDKKASLAKSLGINVFDTVKSNVKILEEMKVPNNTHKIILWKGVGRDNVLHFIWNGKDWSVKQGWF